MCSGHGVFSHACVCDLGFTGPQCQDNIEIETQRDETTASIVTESIKDSLPLARILSAGGYTVTLILPTDVVKNRDMIRDIDDHGIKIKRQVTSTLKI
jgi:hypothetical protein